MIPALIVPLLNRPDLLHAMYESIDHPVDTMVVIDNGGCGPILDRSKRNVGHVRSIEPGHNLGVAASWNLGMKVTPSAPWWLIVNADVTFAPGALAALAEQMTDAAEIRCLVEFGAFGITAAAIDNVGWFDENFVPIYCEDTDYRRRCALAGVPIIDVPNESRHVGSVSLQGPNANAISYPANVGYYRRKWGGWIGRETFDTPFDSGESVAYWRLDRRRLAELGWPQPWLSNGEG